MDRIVVYQMTSDDLREFVEKELSQKQLAEEVGIATSSIAGIELGQKGLSVEKMVRICKGLNISLSDLFPIEIQSDTKVKEKMLKEIMKSLKTFETTNLRIFKMIVDGFTIKPRTV